MEAAKFAEYTREKPSNEPEGNVIISCYDEDLTKPLLCALAVLDESKPKDFKSHVESVKFIYRGEEIGNLSKESIIKYIVDSYGFETPGESYILNYICPVGNERRTVTGGTSYVPTCRKHNIAMIRDEHK